MKKGAVGAFLVYLMRKLGAFRFASLDGVAANTFLAFRAFRAFRAFLTLPSLLPPLQPPDQLPQEHLVEAQLARDRRLFEQRRRHFQHRHRAFGLDDRVPA